MTLKALMVTAAIAAGAALIPLTANANVVPPVKSAQSIAGADSSLVEHASRRCWFWRNECAARWGWGNWRFRRCLARHGCW